jgi:C4-dicarboxylate-specific signal transduction histidine kinase
MTTPFAEDVVPVPVPTRAERIENAKQFLKENLTETIIACAARIYDLTEIIARKTKKLESSKSRR